MGYKCRLRDALISSRVFLTLDYHLLQTKQYHVQDTHADREARVAATAAALHDAKCASDCGGACQLVAGSC